MRQLRILRRACVGMILVAVFVTPLKGQEARATEDVRRLLQQHVESLNHEIDVLNRRIDDVMFFQRLGDIAEIDLVSFTGPPRHYQPNPTAQGAGTRSIVWTPSSPRNRVARSGAFWPGTCDRRSRSNDA